MGVFGKLLKIGRESYEPNFEVEFKGGQSDWNGYTW